MILYAKLIKILQMRDICKKVQKVSYQQSVRYISASEQNPFEMSRSVISSGLMASLSEMFC